MRFTGLWRHPDFLKLWAGQTISLFGTLISKVALPFTAVLVLQVGPLEMGLLRAASVLPGLLIGLVAGAWVDRLRRRPILIGTDLGQAILLGSVPLAAVAGVLRVEQLYLVSFLTGVLTVFFEVAYRSFLPTLVRREDLVEGNSKLQATGSVAEIAGFGLAGAIVQAVTAPIAVLIDAVSFLVSAVCLIAIRADEPAPPPPPPGGPSVLREIGEGLRFVGGNPLLRTVALVAVTQNFAMDMTGAAYMLYLTNELHLEPVLQGVLFGLGGVGTLLAALVAERAVDRFGLGPTLFWALALAGAAALFVPLAAGPLAVVVACIVVQQLLGDGALTVYFINQVSLRQAITPDRVQGRMHATIRFLGWTSMLFGALAGGFLGGAIGLRATLVVGGVLLGLSACWLIGSPLGRLRERPAPVPGAAEAG